MGKYAYVKLSIILYHNQTNLSIGFAKVLEKYFFKSLLINEKGKRKPLSRRGNHALKAAILCFVLRIISWISFHASDSQR